MELKIAEDLKVDYQDACEQLDGKPEHMAEESIFSLVKELIERVSKAEAERDDALERNRTLVEALRELVEAPSTYNIAMKNARLALQQNAEQERSAE